MLSKKGSGRSRGIAFVDLADEKQMVRALRVHHTRLFGRVINVERTCGGGGTGDDKNMVLLMDDVI